MPPGQMPMPATGLRAGMPRGRTPHRASEVGKSIEQSYPVNLLTGRAPAGALTEGESGPRHRKERVKRLVFGPDICPTFQFEAKVRSVSAFQHLKAALAARTLSSISS